MKKLIISLMIVIGITIALLISCGGEGTVDGLAPPSKPSPSNGETISDATPLLNWEDIDGALNYHVQVNEANDFTGTVIVDDDTLTASEYQCEDELTNETTYYWRVRAQNSGGTWTEWSETWSFYVDLSSQIPANPIPGDTHEIYDTELLLGWGDIGGAVEYELHLAEDDDWQTGVNLIEVVVGGEPPSSEYQVTTTLEIGKTYYWRVRVKTENEWIDWSNSNTWSFTVVLVKFPIPNYPSPFDGYIIDQTPLLEWEDIDGALNYHVQVNEANDFTGPNIEDDDTLTESEYQVATTLGFWIKYYWRVRILDETEWSEWSRTFGFTVVDLPTVNVSGVTPTNNDPPTWDWDDVGSVYRYGWTDDVWITQTATVSEFTPGSELGEGPHTLYVQAGDEYGHWSPESGFFIITVDTTEPSAPTITSSSHPTETDWYNDNTPEFSMSADGTGSGIQGYSYEMDQSISTIPDENRDTTGSSYTSPTRSDGIWYFHVRAQDEAGNWGPTSHYRVYIDVTPPSAIVISSSTTHPDETEWYNDDSPVFEWTQSSDDTSDIWGYSTVIDQSPSTIPNETANVFALTWAPNIPSDGTWYCHVRAVDNAGNGGPTDHYTVNIDTTDPTVTVNNLLTRDQTPQLTGTVNETSATIEVTVDGTTYGATNNGNGTWTLADGTISTLAEGTYDVLAEATDAAGNTGSDTTSGELVIDRTPPGTPTVTGTTPTSNERPTWDWDDVGSVYRYGWTDGVWITETATVSEFTPGSDLGEGPHTLYVQAGDDVLPEPNWSDSGSFTISIDLTAPGQPDVSGDETPTYDDTPTWNWDPVDGATQYRYSFTDGSGWTVTSGTDYDFEPSSPLGIGEHTLYVQAGDDVPPEPNWSGSGSFTIEVYQKLTPPDVITGGEFQFGYSVAISNDGSTMVVGANIADNNSDPNYNSGSVYVYTWNSSTGHWEHNEQRDKLSTGGDGDRFGTSVAISSDGSIIVVGALHYPSWRGAAYVYEGNDDDGWDLSQSLTASDGADGDRFGFSVSISGEGQTVGDVIVVGAQKDDTSAGSAYVYRYNGATWSELNKITAFDRVGSDLFGFSVAVSLDGSRIVVGARGVDSAYPTWQDDGAAYVYTWDATEGYHGIQHGSQSWGFTALHYATDDSGLVDDETYTCTVTVDGTDNPISIIGSAADRTYGYVIDEINDDLTGATASWEYTGNGFIRITSDSTGPSSTISITDTDLFGSLTDHNASAEPSDTLHNENHKLVASDGGDGYDYFGYSVAISGDGNTIVVGAKWDEPFDAGSAYVYEWNTSQWDEVQKLTASDRYYGDYFGCSVAISNDDGNTIVAGAYRDDDVTSEEPPNASNNTEIGSAYIYEYGTTQYDESEKITASDRADYEEFGWSVAVSGDGNIIVIGAYGDDDMGSNMGSVSVFSK